NSELVEKVKKGETVPNYIRGGLKAGIVKTSPYGKMVTEEAKKAADEAKAKLLEGDFIIFKGPVKGTAVVENKETKEWKEEPFSLPAGKGFKQDDPELEKMNYLVEGVIAAR